MLLGVLLTNMIHSQVIDGAKSHCLQQRDDVKPFFISQKFSERQRQFLPTT